MIFIDTGAFIARYLRGDQYHRKAVRLWARLATTREPWLTSSFVLDETITLLARRAGYRFACDRARIFYSSANLEILRPEADDEIAALGWFEKFADQKVSFTDCVSFALMRRHEIKHAFSFDEHFERAGFHLWR